MANTKKAEKYKRQEFSAFIKRLSTIYEEKFMVFAIGTRLVYTRFSLENREVFMDFIERLQRKSCPKSNENKD